ncbi:MAG: hypothetical protein FJ150_02855 [Euryarchaeota archaeon]|nr:hypothetical protein [Euryarchaeota archaeon]
MKKFFAKFTIIDVVIILILIFTVVFGFIKTSDIQSNIQKFTFDSLEMDKVYGKYQDLYGQGKVVNSKIIGYNSLSGKKGDVYGKVLWCSEKDILLDVNGTKILASRYNNKYADFYIESVTLEVVGTEKNAVDIVFEPKDINRMGDLLLDIPGIAEYKVDTKISIQPKEGFFFQRLSNELYEKEKHVSITPLGTNNNIINVTEATVNDIKLADEILGDINGKTDFITIRIYNIDDNMLELIKKKYKIKKIVKFS